MPLGDELRSAGQEADAIEGRVGSLEQQLSTLVNEVSSNDAAINSLQNDVADISDRVESLEGATPEPEEPEPEPEPPEPDPEPVPLPEPAGTPQFSEIDGGVEVSWEASELAASYIVSSKLGEQETMETSVVLDIVDGDWVCVKAKNASGAAEQSCNTFIDATPEPEPPSDGDWTLLHEFSPAAGGAIPDGVEISENDGSWVPGGKSERTADGYLMTYLEGMEDGRGPGQLIIGPKAIPNGKLNIMCEYDMEVSSNFEDHIVYNKISHHRVDQPPKEIGPDINFGSKWVFRFKNYKLAGTSDSGVEFIRDQLEDTRHPRDRYPEFHAGYNSLGGNIANDSIVGGQKHTIRIAIEHNHQDANFREANWYRWRWWLDGVLQADYPDFVIWGGPYHRYWEISPTWGGNSGHFKEREDYMLVSRVKTWVR